MNKVLCAVIIVLCIALGITLAANKPADCGTSNMVSYEKGWACALDRSTCEGTDLEQTR